MPEWPDKPAIRACVAWNEDERKRATADKRPDDAARFARNIKALKERL